ncbi:hypothetical protein, partial [Paenibacillus sp. Y412MC10]|uniref:hypothetical protein n=1 Tax=Geobacillus sp. (strain Y412MC10) TaxID=481743 RepID=UPI001C92C0C6
MSEKMGDFMMGMMGTVGVGVLEEGDNELYVGGVRYGGVVELGGEGGGGGGWEGDLGVGGMWGEWNEFDGGEGFGVMAAESGG